MSGCCNCLTAEGLAEQLDFAVRETDTGVTVEVTPRDPENVGALKGLARGIRAFCRTSSRSGGCC